MSGRQSITSSMVLDGRYELGRVIAEGGMAEVRYARDLRLKREVAVKILRPQFAASPEFLDRFHREAELAAKFPHPNLVTVFDVGHEAPGLHYIVMELLPGRTLKDLLADGPLPIEEAVDLTRQVAIGMAFAHRKGLVHRDLKPQNVLLTDAHHAKVADFGLALTGESSQLTQPGTVWGTVQYLSPEQAQGYPADTRSDVYSLGAIFYELLTGRPPFEGATPAAIMMKHVYDDPPDATVATSSVPPAAARVAQIALAKNPDDRFQTMEELAQALTDIRDAASAETAIWGALPSSRAGQRVTSRVAVPDEATRGFTPPDFQTQTTAIAPAKRQPPARVGDRAAIAPIGGKRPARRKGSRLPMLLAGAVLLFFALMAAGAALARQLVDGAVFGPRPVPTRAPIPTEEPTPAPTPSPTVVLIPVPNVTGDPLPTAQAKLANFNLTAETTEDFSREVARGSVVSQDPLANARLEQGTPVRLVVSRGPQRIGVPNVVGKTYEEATAELSSAGFTVRRREANSLRRALTIFEQQPAAGETVDVGSEVTVAVSLGPRSITMPGARGRPLEEVTRQLAALGLAVKTVDVTDTSVPPGAVSSTSPDANAVVTEGSEVIVTVNRIVPTQAATATVPPPSATATRPGATATAAPRTPTPARATAAPTGAATSAATPRPGGTQAPGGSPAPSPPPR